MKILRLRMVDYRRHRDTEVEFGDGVTAVIGRNGSGKTSLLEAIAFALYGTHAVRTNKALIRHDGAAPGDPVRVELDAEVAGQAMRIVRELRGVNQTGYASLSIDGQVIVPAQAGSSDAVTEEVSRRIGLDRETFFTSVFAEQKQLSRLADKSKAERKRLLLNMVGVDAIDRAIQEARTRRRESEARMTALQERVPDMEAVQAEVAARQAGHEAAVHAAQQSRDAWRAAQRGLDEAVTRLQAAEAERRAHRSASDALREAQTELRHLHATAQDLAARIATATQAQQEVERLRPASDALPAARQTLQAALEAHAARRRLDDLHRQVEDARAARDRIAVPPTPNGRLEEAEAAMVTARDRHDTAQQALATATASHRAVQDRRRRIARLEDSADCPVCERPLEGHGDALQQHLQDEAARHEEALQACTRAADLASASLAEARRVLAQVQAEQQAHAQAAQARRHAEAHLAAVEARWLQAQADAPADPGPIDRLRQDVEEAEAAHAQMARASANAAALPGLQEQHRSTQDALRAATTRQDDATASLQRLAHVPEAAAAAEGAHAAAAKAERDAEREHGARQHAVALAEAAYAAATRRAAEAREAQEALRQARRDHRYWEVLGGTRGAGLLERFRNHLVGRIGPAISQEASRLLARFTADRYTEVILDDFEIYVSDGGVRYQLERFSGGEVDLVHLAIRLAVSRLLLERSGAEIRFLALDEVFGSLDQDRRSLVLEALQELGTMYSQVLLVTHHETLQDALDHTILVEDQGGTAVLRHND